MIKEYILDILEDWDNGLDISGELKITLAGKTFVLTVKEQLKDDCENNQTI